MPRSKYKVHSVILVQTEQKRYISSISRRSAVANQTKYIGYKSATSIRDAHGVVCLCVSPLAFMAHKRALRSPG